MFWKHEAQLIRKVEELEEENTRLAEAIATAGARVKELETLGPRPVLTKEVYDAFSKSVSNTSLNSNTSGLEAAYRLGIEHVLKKLREGHTNEY